MPGSFNKQFLEVYNEDDTFFLYDPANKLSSLGIETLEKVLARHVEAGRHNLAQSLQALAEKPA
jgi:hypothetical protein